MAKTAKTDLAKAKADDPAALRLEFDQLAKRLEQELTALENDLEDYVVDGQEDLALMAEVLATCKGHAKRSETLKKRLLAPIVKQEREVRGLIQPITTRLTKLEHVIKNAIAAYHLRKASEQRAALTEASQANKAGQLDDARLALSKIAAAQAETVKGVSVRYTIDIEIEDESQVPDEWWDVNVDRIAKFARSTNGEVSIPGVVYHKRPIVSSLSK